jgi:hypothetical protein
MKQFFLFIGIVVMLTGCMYPSEERQQLANVDTHLARVQAQSEQLLQQTKTLPYTYTQDERKFTSHYLVNVKQLPEIPPTAYEKGGNFYYVFVGAEGNNPFVRLFDLRLNDEVERVQQAVQWYFSKYKRFPTTGKAVDGYYNINLAAVKMEKIKIPSPYYGDSQLPILLDEKGMVYLDYRGDALRMIQEAALKPPAGEDLRVFLAKNSRFVPAFSPHLYLQQEGVIRFNKSTE